MPPVVNRDDVEAREVAEGDIAFSPADAGGSGGRARGSAAASTWCPPGARQMPVHVHGDEEEIFFVARRRRA